MHEHNTVTSSMTCKCGSVNVEICILCYQAVHNCKIGESK